MLPVTLVCAIAAGGWWAYSALAAGSSLPAPTLSSGPSNPTDRLRASFVFSDSQHGVSYKCRLDRATFAKCSSPKGYAHVRVGTHSFQVEAVVHGSASSATTFSWLVDRTAPSVVSIDRLDPSPTALGSVRWSVIFTKAVSGVSAGDFALRTTGLRGARVSGVSGSGTRYTLTAVTGNGTGTLAPKLGRVRSIRDAAGQQLAGTPFVGQAYSVARTVPPPTPAITGQPDNPSSSASATFAFRIRGGSSGGPLSFVCSLDSAAFARCGSPKSYHGLGQGSHTFAVESVDRAGDHSPAATYGWVVDTVAPAVAFDETPPNPDTSTSPSFAFHATDPVPGSGVASIQCRLDGKAWQACTSPDGLHNLSLGSHTFDLQAFDGSGNRSQRVSYTWTIQAQQSAKPFTIDGNATGLLYPGGPAEPIAVTFHNPNSVPIFVTSLTVTLDTGGFPADCSSADFRIGQASIPVAGIDVPAGGQVTLPAQGGTAPTIRMADDADQDACKNATIGFTYGGSAHS